LILDRNDLSEADETNKLYRLQKVRRTKCEERGMFSYWWSAHWLLLPVNSDTTTAGTVVIQLRVVGELLARNALRRNQFTHR